MKTITKTKVSTNVAVISIVAAALGIGLISYGFGIGFIQINPNVIYVPPEVCDNGIDDDKDGLTDCKDTASCPLGSTKCPNCNSISITSPVGKDWYRLWNYDAPYYKIMDILQYQVKNTNTNSACNLTLKSGGFKLQKSNDSWTRWEVKDIVYYQTDYLGQPLKTLNTPATCSRDSAMCRYDWSAGNIVLKPGETAYFRVRGDVSLGLPLKAYINFSTKGSDTVGYPTLTATDARGIEYKKTTALDGIKANLLLTKPTDP